ncbi:MAG: energy-coupling factor transporter ATPase [Acidobacteriota bacterium]
MIEVKGVSFTYPGQDSPALQDVTFSVAEGDFVAILGRNGSGKSTLARMLNGLLQPTQGEIIVDGISTRDASQATKVRQMVGLLFSNPDNQLVSQIVEEDIAFGPENLGLSPEIIEERVHTALAMVGMEDFRKHPPHLLSGGQKQRIAIAGVLALKPKYMVLDEPTAMLDPLGRDEVIKNLLYLNREEGTGVILITHHVEEALLAKYVLVMDHGQVAMAGLPQEVLIKAAALEELGLEAPGPVLLAESLRKKGWEIPAIIESSKLVDYICRSTSKM